MAKKGTINYIDRELTQDEFDSIGYPALYILKGNNQIVKFILFDQFGDRLDSNFSLDEYVPYNYASRDLNIGANYFKTTKGFDYTKNLENFFRTYHNGDYNASEFSSSHPDMGIMLKYSNVEEGQQYNFNGPVYSTQYGINGGFFRVDILNKTTNTTNNLIFDENGFTTNKPIYSQGGFVLYPGTVNQALTADGGAFDLDSKADLVDGKIKREQSQPSTMVMNNSTYVITFTDATGAVQTIDLPLESLFKDANYNSSTKSLIVTLQDGTTRTIPLTDLVDLPEIVLATTNPAVTPTSGQKVYFNTSLGKVWFNVSGVWVFGGNLMTDAEKTKLANTSGTNTGDETGASITTKLGFTPENSSNKSTDILSDKTSNSKFPSVKAIYDYVSGEFQKKVNIGSDTVFNFKNLSAMTLAQFKAISPNLETIYFTDEQNATGWQSLRNDNNIITSAGETLITFIDGDSNGDSQFSLIDLTNAKINGVFEKDFIIIKFNAGVVTPATANQWFKVILKINGVQTAVSPVFYLLETAGTIENIAHNFALNVPAEMLVNGATLHVKTSTSITFNNPTITVVRVHKYTTANL